MKKQLGDVGVSGNLIDLGSIRVFTTRVDTIYGATCVILAPEHPLNATLLDEEGKAHR